MFRRCLTAAVVLALCAILPTLGQDKDKDKGKDKSKDTPAEKTLLKWKLEKDKTFYQKMTTETKQTMKVMNNDVIQTQKQTFYFSWTPTKQEGDVWTLKQKIEGVAMDIDIGNQKITYNSLDAKGDANNSLTEFFKALVGSEFTLTLDTKTMKVTKIEGREEFLKKLVQANPQMKPLLEQILTEKALMEMAEPTFAAIPGEEKKKGDTWERKTTLNMGPIGSYENTYKYTDEGKDGSLDKIKVDATLKYKEPGEVAGAGSSGLPFKIKSAELKSTSGTGVIWFDPAKGRIDKSEMSLQLEGKLNIEIGGQTTEVTLSQSQKSNLETADKSFAVEKK